jgi:ribosomal protein L29
MNTDMSQESLCEMLVCDVEFADSPLDKVAHWLRERDIVINELRTEVATLKVEHAALKAETATLKAQQAQLLRAIRHWIKDGLTLVDI